MDTLRPRSGRRSESRGSSSIHHSPHQGPAYGHQDQDDAERADDGSSGRQVDLERQIDSQRRDQRAHGPADGQARADVFRRRASRPPTARSDSRTPAARRRWPPKTSLQIQRRRRTGSPRSAPTSPALRPPAMMHRDQQKLLPATGSETVRRRRRAERFIDLRPGDGQDVADQHFFQMLGLCRRFAHGQNRGGRGHGVADADDGLLRDPAPCATRPSRIPPRPRNVNARLIQ